MSKAKILGLAVAGLIAAIVVFSYWPKKNPAPTQESLETLTEIVQVIDEIPTPPPAVFTPPPQEHVLTPVSDDSHLPADVDRMHLLFQPSHSPLLPIVESVTYASRTPWLSGRPVYLGDYASHFKTSKHFISRSLHGIGNYFSEIVSKGDRFNVLRTDKEISFHLVLDLSRLKLWFYAHDQDEGSRILLKTYHVCAGRLNSSSPSGSLTPLGIFSIGQDCAVYKPGIQGTFRGEACEMLTVFGVRWLPLDKEIAYCTASSKGLGLHGAPWKKDPETGEYVENRECIGHYESSGCIRLLSEDVEELYSVIVSRPTYIQIVSDFSEATLPGQELAL